MATIGATPSRVQVLGEPSEERKWPSPTSVLTLPEEDADEEMVEHPIDTTWAPITSGKGLSLREVQAEGARILGSSALPDSKMWICSWGLGDEHVVLSEAAGTRQFPLRALLGGMDSVPESLEGLAGEAAAQPLPDSLPNLQATLRAIVTIGSRRACNAIGQGPGLGRAEGHVLCLLVRAERRGMSRACRMLSLEHGAEGPNGVTRFLGVSCSQSGEVPMRSEAVLLHNEEESTLQGDLYNREAVPTAGKGGWAEEKASKGYRLVFIGLVGQEAGQVILAPWDSSGGSSTGESLRGERIGGQTGESDSTDPEREQPVQLALLAHFHEVTQPSEVRGWGAMFSDGAGGGGGGGGGAGNAADMKGKEKSSGTSDSRAAAVTHGDLQKLREELKEELKQELVGELKGGQEKSGGVERYRVRVHPNDGELLFKDPLTSNSAVSVTPNFPNAITNPSPFCTAAARVQYVVDIESSPRHPPGVSITIRCHVEAPLPSQTTASLCTPLISRVAFAFAPLRIPSRSDPEQIKLSSPQVTVAEAAKPTLTISQGLSAVTSVSATGSIPSLSLSAQASRQHSRVLTTGGSIPNALVCSDESTVANGRPVVFKGAATLRVLPSGQPFDANQPEQILDRPWCLPGECWNAQLGGCVDVSFLHEHGSFSKPFIVQAAADLVGVDTTSLRSWTVWGSQAQSVTVWGSLMAKCEVRITDAVLTRPMGKPVNIFEQPDERLHARDVARFGVGASSPRSLLSVNQAGGSNSGPDEEAETGASQAGGSPGPVEEEGPAETGASQAGGSPGPGEEEGPGLPQEGQGRGSRLAQF